MRLRSLAISPVEHPDPPRAAPRPLPLEIAFLAGDVDPALLDAAASISRCVRVCAARALIAGGGISAAFYYRAFARHLGVPFEAAWPVLEPDIDVRAAFRSGYARVAGEARWLHAPQGEDLRVLLSGRLAYLDQTSVSITTPSHLAAVIQSRAQSALEAIATHELSTTAPRHSAKGALDATTWRVAVAIAVCLTAVGIGAPRVLYDVIGLLFGGAIVLRLFAAAASLAPPARAARPLSDAELPRYTVLVPLHQEADVLPDLLAALAALDYPRAELEVLVLIEPEDHGTRAALAASGLPPWMQVVFAPRVADLRTKPRALNLGLAMATGEFLTVYDAEDRPDPDQLRLAAAAFRAEPDVSCLQAPIAIDNGDVSVIARLFAIEYAALFNVLNAGTALLRLPLALGGTSNHFRCAALRAAGGWDPWNVTEDADLGLRLARLGHRVGYLASRTIEAAPESAAVWFKQRRRWMKGWVQTLLVILRDAPTAVRDLGARQSVALVCLLVGMVLGPFCLPSFFCVTIYRLVVHGLPVPHDAIELAEATLAAAVPAYGLVSMLWVAVLGMSRGGLRRFWPSLPLILPYQLMISAAALAALRDLVRSPYHWHKTPHGRHRPASCSRVSTPRRPASRSGR